MLLTNGVIMMGELAERELESYSEPEVFSTPYSREHNK
jgi:hypothetical protein